MTPQVVCQLVMDVVMKYCDLIKSHFILPYTFDSWSDNYFSLGTELLFNYGVIIMPWRLFLCANDTR